MYNTNIVKLSGINSDNDNSSRWQKHSSHSQMLVFGTIFMVMVTKMWHGKNKNGWIVPNTMLFFSV